MRGLVLLASSAALATACGGAPRAETAASAPATEKAAPTPRPAPPPKGTLRRADVNAVLDAGFGRFLQTVAVEPRLDAGRFRGWTILDLEQGPFYDAVDLKPGDVVTRVNGMPIERDTEAFDAFESLRTASALTVDYARAGTERTIVYRIVP